MLVDTHCHVLSEYYDDIENVIKRTVDNNVGAIIVNGYNMKSNREVLELVKKYDNVYGAIGIHPEEIDEYNEENLEFIKMHLNDDKIIAIGEIGLDYHYDIDKNVQKELFKRQLSIAQEFNKPVIIHTRDCIQETYDIVKDYDVKGIMHCFSGSVEMARLFTKLGFLLGVGGIVTFKNARRAVEVIENISLEYIVLETDSPYLAPVPYRGRVNEPSYLPVILQKICDIKGLNYNDACDITTANVLRLFDKIINIC